MRYVWPILAIFFARFLSTAVFFPEADGDLGWQRWLGAAIRESARIPRAIGSETFTAPGAAWVPQEWLFSIIASLSNGAGWYIFAACAAVCATGALYLGVLRAVRGGAMQMASCVAVSFAGVALFESFGVRAQVFAWPLLALFLYLIEYDSPVAYGAIVVAALWSNVHASVMLAGPLALAATVGSFLDERWSLRTKRTVTIAIGSLVATCCNPLGIALPGYAISLFSSPFKSLIAEWRHTDFGDISFVLGALPLLLILTALGSVGSTRWRDRSIVLVTAVLMFSAARNIAIFAIACFPIVARSLCFGVQYFAKAEHPASTRAEISASRLIPLFSLVLAAVVTWALVAQSRKEVVVTDSLQTSLAAVRSLPGRHRVFCADFAWCSFLLGNSRDRIFLDGRADPYPQAVWDDFETIVGVKHGWDEALRSHGTDVVIASVKSPLEEVLELSHDWRSAYRNRTFQVWVLVPAVVLMTDRCKQRFGAASHCASASSNAQLRDP